ELTKNLSINGRPATEQIGTNFLLVDMGDTGDPVAEPNPDLKRIQAYVKIIDFKPHVIVWSTIPTFAIVALGPLMRQWPAATPSALHLSTNPVWKDFILNGLNSLNNAPPIREQVRSRFFGVQAFGPDFTDANFKVFETAVGASFLQQTDTIGFTQTVYYDAM